MRIGTALATALVVAVTLFTSPGASAATEFGDRCTADNEFTGAATLFEISAAANPLPTAAPTAGVITSWTVSVIPVPFAFSQTLEVLRPTGAPSTVQIVAKAVGNLSSGTNVLNARIPVQPGDRLGLFGEGPIETLICETAETNVIGGFIGGGPEVGATTPYDESSTQKYRIPVAATIEPDADNDGFGDETQDKCPQSAALQTECPVVVLDSFALRKKSSIVVLIAASETGPVSVSGTAKLPKGGKKAKSSAKAKLKKLTKNVTAGKIGKFTLKFPGSLRSALAGLPSGKSITVKLEASARNVTGTTSKDRTKLKLKG